MNIEKKLLISLLIVTMCIMAFMGCDHGIFATFKPNEELFEYTCYDKGSYWVYEDSATHKIDSLLVITKPVKTATNAEYGSTINTKTFSFQYFYSSEIANVKDTFIFKPTVHGNLLHYTNLGWNPEWFYTNPFHSIDNKGKTFRGSYILGYINMPTPIDDSEGERLCETNALPWCKKYYQSYMVEGNEYADVKKMVATGMYKYPFDSIVTYWAKNIGVIRYEYYDSISSSIMNLVRYDVKNLKKKEVHKK